MVSKEFHDPLVGAYITVIISVDLFDMETGFWLNLNSLLSLSLPPYWISMTIIIDFHFWEIMFNKIHLLYRGLVQQWALYERGTVYEWGPGDVCLYMSPRVERKRLYIRLVSQPLKRCFTFTQSSFYSIYHLKLYIWRSLPLKFLHFYNLFTFVNACLYICFL